MATYERGKFYAQLSGTRKRLTEALNVTLIGNVGRGKSSLWNKLCPNDPKQKVGRDESITRFCQTGGNQQMQVMDTPGQCSVDDQLNHSLNLHDGLVSRKHHLLVLVICASTRQADPVKEVKKLMGIVQSEENGIVKGDEEKKKAEKERRKSVRKAVVILVTKMDVVERDILEDDFDGDEDQLDSPEYISACTQSLEKQKNALKEYIRDIPVIFTGRRVTGPQLEELFFDQAYGSQTAVTLTYTPAEFAYDFEIAHVPNGQQEERAEEYVKAYTRVCDRVLRLIQSTSQLSLDDAGCFLSDLLHSLRDRYEQVCSQYQDEFGEAMVETDSFTHYIYMKNQLLGSFKSTRQEILKKWDSAHRDNHNKKQTQYRKCPHPGCGMIWLKAHGCDGSTTCGDRPVQKGNESWFGLTYKFCFDGTDITFQVVRSEGGGESVAASSERRIGCGKTIVWSAMEVVDDDVIAELWAGAAEGTDYRNGLTIPQSRFPRHVD